MPDNGFFSVTLPQDPGAFNAARGAFLYHLVADYDTLLVVNEVNVFKVVVQGQPFLLAGSTIGFIAFPPQGLVVPGSINAPPTTYDGTFSFNFFVPQPADRIDLFDGDADRLDDTDDPNSPAFPPFQTSPFTFPQGVNPGIPMDTTVTYTINAPGNVWIVSNTNPSGNQEWELFRILPSASADGTQDVVVPTAPAGLYSWNFAGFLPLNNLFIHAEFDLFPPPPPDGPSFCDLPAFAKARPGSSIGFNITNPGFLPDLVSIRPFFSGACFSFTPGHPQIVSIPPGGTVPFLLNAGNCPLNAGRLPRNSTFIIESRNCGTRTVQVEWVLR
jgi:hypothetical protein